MIDISCASLKKEEGYLKELVKMFSENSHTISENVRQQKIKTLIKDRDLLHEASRR